MASAKRSLVIDTTGYGEYVSELLNDIGRLACIALSMAGMTYLKTGRVPAHVPEVYINVFVGVSLYWLVVRKVIEVV